MADEGRKRKMQRKKGANLMKNLFKKIGALLVAAVMVLSMCTAVFATEQETSVANDKASLTVKGLVPGENTTVAVYKVVGWSAEHSSWEVENEAIKNDVNLDKNPVTIDCTTLQLFHKKNIVQDFLMYNEFDPKHYKGK